MRDWFRRRREAKALLRHAIPDDLWRLTLARYPFLARHGDTGSQRLRDMSALFLASKELSGAHGLLVTDEMAVAIAAQACLPVLELGLDWYDGFVGIVVHEGIAVAHREVVDDDGVVHSFAEELTGEAVHGGPVMLSWEDVASSDESAHYGYNVVIHEFVHVLDMRNGNADGVPALPDRASHEHWIQVIGQAFDTFCQRVDGGEDTWLDPYGAQGVEEFFAVASEAFFVAPIDFRATHPDLHTLFCGFFRQDPAAASLPMAGA